MKVKSINKKYYKYLDFMRVFFCFAILLYHLNILKGGYLAVCSFFTLSGYLATISALSKESFSLSSYYLDRFKKIYLPLLIVVFISVGTIIIIGDISWLNLKPEVTSILLGYNNYWQLGVNADYFARHLDSPFMHLWYISILLQFELVFPFIYLLFKKLKTKFNKKIPIIISVLLSISSFILFFITNYNGNIMLAYYGTLRRVFSIFFGISLGLIHTYYKPIIPKVIQDRNQHKLVIYLYTIISLVIFCLVSSSSNYFAISMLIITLITCRLISYSVISKNKSSKSDNIIKLGAGISYYVYLIQYPLIFIFQYSSLNQYIKIILIIIILIILSIILRSIINKKIENKLIKYIITITILGFSLFGLYQYVIAKDHTKEMKALEEQLLQNSEVLEQKQAEYIAKLQQGQDNLQKSLQALEQDESKLGEFVSSLRVVGIGDSVLLGAVNNLYAKFPNGYFDGKVSRTAHSVSGILQSLKANGGIGEPIVLNLGANGDCSESCKNEIMSLAGNRNVFWLTVTNDRDVHFNNKITNYASKYSNLNIIDWNSISSGHPEYFYADGLHLTPTGRAAYTEAIYNSIYNLYKEEFKTKKEQLLKEYEDEFKTKITFYGNDVLTNAFMNLQSYFSEDNFIIDKTFNYETLKNKIEEAVKDDSITNKIVFAFDDTLNLSIEEYQELINICKDYQIYLLSISASSDKNIKDLIYDNVKIIDFYNEIKLNNDYLMADKVHLTSIGNERLTLMLNDILNNNISE